MPGNLRDFRNEHGTVALFADGGTFRHEGREGITWAWRWVGYETASELITGGRVTGQECGCESVPPGGAPSEVAEMTAVMKGMSGLPDGWTGYVVSDSLNTLRRIVGASDGNWSLWGCIPRHLIRSMEWNLCRLGAVSPLPVQSHPSIEDFYRGFYRDEESGEFRMVSIHNEWCDTACQIMKPRTRRTAV
jgi:hypothetical protein